MRVFAIVRAFSGVVAYVFLCAEAIFGGLCYDFFGKHGWNLSPHCKAGNWHQGDTGDALKILTLRPWEQEDGATV